ncbi:RPII140-upstream gene protein-like isoform X2 [Mercenaria mercenaria]|uniref:RPII140-upstream gene protein-like isoform X2 n=1 Tax=Mercenaria mercenaria TaxID=6596 RepID=UPI00234F92CE|nr:RPII140-upstream gene protein-like isoform X2 [Mercenaria mercenaria]
MKSEDVSYNSNKITFMRPFRIPEMTWLVYKQLVNKMQARKLSCMAPVSEVVNTGTLDIKAKMKEMQQLEADIQQFITSETPIQRLKRTFTFDVNTGKSSVQAARFEMVVKTAVFGLFGFGCLKGYYEGREEFMRANKVTMFASRGAAHKRRSNHIMRCVLRCGSLLAWKGGLCCSSVFGLYQCIEIYMNKTTPWSLTFAFGVGGSLMKIGLGPKGMFSGFVIASFLGRFQKKELHPVTEYHEEVDDIE